MSDLWCVPTVAGFDDFELEANSAAEALELAAAYIEANECGEADEGLAIDHTRRPYTLECFVEPDMDPGPVIDRDCDYWNRIT